MANPLILPLVLAGGAATVGGIAWFRSRKKKDQLTPKPGGKALPEGGGTVTPQDAEQAKTAAEIVGPLVSSNTVASFHAPSSGDSPSSIARRSLRAVHPDVTDQQVAAMRRALAKSTYNQQVYGEPTEADYYHPDGVRIDKAMNPKHEGPEVLRAGYMPRRNIDAGGKRIGVAQKRGALWVPDVNVDALKSGVSDFDILFATAWPDGTSGLEPPPDFWEAAVVRPAIGS